MHPRAEHQVHGAHRLCHNRGRPPCPRPFSLSRYEGVMRHAAWVGSAPLLPLSMARLHAHYAVGQPVPPLAVTMVACPQPRGARSTVGPALAALPCRCCHGERPPRLPASAAALGLCGDVPGNGSGSWRCSPPTRMQNHQEDTRAASLAVGRAVPATATLQQSLRRC